jgi:hypothetical protein
MERHFFRRRVKRGNAFPCWTKESLPAGPGRLGLISELKTVVRCRNGGTAIAKRKEVRHAPLPAGHAG